MRNKEAAVPLGPMFSEPMAAPRLRPAKSVRRTKTNSGSVSPRDQASSRRVRRGHEGGDRRRCHAGGAKERSAIIDGHLHQAKKMQRTREREGGSVPGVVGSGGGGGGGGVHEARERGSSSRDRTGVCWLLVPGLESGLVALFITGEGFSSVAEGQSQWGCGPRPTKNARFAAIGDETWTFTKNL